MVRGICYFAVCFRVVTRHNIKLKHEFRINHSLLITHYIAFSIHKKKSCCWYNLFPLVQVNTHHTSLLLLDSTNCKLNGALFIVEEHRLTKETERRGMVVMTGKVRHPMQPHRRHCLPVVSHMHIILYNYNL